MKFKEWINLDEVRYGGLWAKWKAAHPNVPDYVLKQMYINHISSGMRNEIDPDWQSKKKSNQQSNDPTTTYLANPPQSSTPSNSQTTTTVGWMPKQPQQANNIYNNLPSDIMRRRDMLSGISWNKKPQIIDVNPLSFDQRTLKTFLSWQFGYNALNHVRDDAGRTQTQRQLASQRKDGENEPIIMIDLGQGIYQLIEGFHRTSSYLLQGAPPDQLELIKNGQTANLDFSKWRPIKIKAYIGRKANTQNPYIVPQNAPAVSSQAATAGYNNQSA